jgi:uncharacterized protein (TIGR02145 family)
MKKAILLFVGFVFFALNIQAQTVTDIDGNVYQTVTIGTQIWLVENLKTTRLNDGVPISLVSDSIAWGNLTTPGYCWYYNDAASYKNTYGAIYNWYTVGTGKLCPANWHVPSDNEWTVLTDFLGGGQLAGGKMKSTGTIENGTGLWYAPNTGATNESGFTAFPGGRRFPDGSYNMYKFLGWWWATTEWVSVSAYYRSLGNLTAEVYVGATYKNYGFSVRCVKNSGSGMNSINYLNMLKIYPNPAQDQITIEISKELGESSMAIVNIEGQGLLKQRISGEKTIIDITNIPCGVYFVRIISEKTVAEEKIIKQ